MEWIFESHIMIYALNLTITSFCLIYAVTNHLSGGDNFISAVMGGSGLSIISITLLWKMDIIKLIELTDISFKNVFVFSFLLLLSSSIIFLLVMKIVLSTVKRKDLS